MRIASLEKELADAKKRAKKLEQDAKKGRSAEVEMANVKQRASELASKVAAVVAKHPILSYELKKELTGVHSF